jgi:gliding motility-associated-like protein
MKKLYFFILIFLLAAHAPVFAQTPAISSFSPSSGGIGTTVTITGSGFDTAPANNVVYFGATRAAVTTATATELKVTAPAGGTYQYIAVTNTATNLTAYSKSQFIYTYPSKGAIQISATTATDFDAKFDVSPTVDPNIGIKNPLWVAFADLDGDGKPDMITTSGGSTSTSAPYGFIISIILNNFTKGSGFSASSLGTKIKLQGSTATASSTGLYGVTTGDLDGDGKPDLVVSNNLNGTISVFKNMSSGVGNISFTQVGSDITVAATPRAVLIQDIDNDGKPDVLVDCFGGQKICILPNTTTAGGTISFGTRVDLGTPSGPDYLAAADLDGDGKVDLVTSNSSGSMSIYRNTSTSSGITFDGRISFITNPVGTSPTTAFSLGVGDLDGDGKPDIVTGTWASSGAQTNALLIYRNVTTVNAAFSTSSFAAPLAINTGNSTYNVALGDMDGDGKPDIVSSNRNENTASIIQNTTASVGNISFNFIGSFAVSTTPQVLAICDLDGDGLSDIAVANQGGTTVSLIRNNPSPFITISSGATTFTSGATVTPVNVDGSLTLYDKKGTLTSGTVTITGNFTAAQDALAFTNSSSATMGNIVGSYDSATGILTLTSASGTATAAQWQAALRTVTYANNSTTTPAALTRTVTFAVNDGTTASASFTKTLSVNFISDATLSSLALSVGTLAPVFASATSTYTASVPNTTTSITVTPTVSDASATVTVNGTTVVSGSASIDIALSPGANTITTVITAHDGTSTKTYTVTVTRLASANADLSALNLSSGTLAPVFNAATGSYTASVSNATTSITITPTVADAAATVTVNGTAVTSGSASGTITLNAGDNNITTIVTAPNGTTTKTYTVVVHRTGSSNANLSDLSLSAGALSPVFSTATNTYAASVTNAVSSITLTPTLADATATITVNGTAVANGSASGAVALNVGSNVINVVVTAQDGTPTNTYTVTVTRDAPISTDASLNALSLNLGTLSPVFSTGVMTYTASVSNSTTSITLTPTTTDATATVTVNGTTVISGAASTDITLNVGTNVITTIITAQDGTTIQTYTVTVTRSASANADLSSLALSTGTLSPVFASATNSYSALVANNVISVTITPTLADATATITVNETAVTSGNASGNIALSVGDNVITTLVTAQNGTSTKTYTVTINRAPSANASLSNISLSSGTLSPVFSSVTGSYTASVANSVTSITLTPTTGDATASVTVNGTAVTSGSASGSIALSVGTNIITTVVTAQDGTTVQTYTVTVTRAQSSNANLSNLSLSNGTLSPVFASATGTYTATVDNATTSITLTPITADATATITVNGTTVTSNMASGNLALNVGSNIITTIVTAQNGTTTQTYTVTITRAQSSDADLANLVLSSGTLTPAFSAGTVSYATGVSNTTPSITLTPTVDDVNATVKVNGNTVSSGSASGAITLIAGDNIITVEVKAQDGTIKTYTVTVNKSALSNNSLLSNIGLSAGTLDPVFSSATNDYTASVSNGTTSVKLTPTVADATASVTVNGTAVSSGSASGSIALNVGSNTLTTEITAENGINVSVYTVDVVRAASANANLSALGISTGTLSPMFAAGTANYTVSVGNNITAISLTPAVADATASVTVNGTLVTSGTASGNMALSVGANVITTVVTAQDGTTIQTYTVTVTRAPSANADLAGLSLSDGTLSPVFATGTNSYAASVANSTLSITITPTIADATATITVNGTGVSSGNASGNINLNVGNNTITTIVTAQDGTTTHTYTVIVNRAPSANANLASIAISNGILSPVFATGTNSYTASVSNSTTSVTITPTLTNATASVTVNGNVVTSGNASGNINLNVGDNTITTVVTAQDGTTTNTYTIVVTRAQSSNADLAALTANTGTLSPAFASASKNYTTTTSATSITVTPSVADATATITVNGNAVSSGSASASVSLAVGDNPIMIKVKAQDGTINTYTITVTRLGLSQTITFASLTAVNYGSADVAPGATSSNSAIPVTYTSSNLAVATITANGNIHVVGAGGTTITASQNGDSNYNAATPVSQSFTVNQVALTINANNQSKVYGAVNPVFTAVYSGFVNNDTEANLTTQAVLSTTATAASAVNTYAINVSGATSTNYTISYVPGTLTVNKATLTITANNATKVYGAANPAFTPVFSGFVNGETKAVLTTQPSLSTIATTASDAGSYPIVASGAIAANYSISYADGSLTVTPKALTIKANNASIVYGAAIPAFTATYTGLVNGDTEASLTSPPTYSTTYTVGSSAGSYAVTPGGAASSNYSFTYSNGTLTVGKAPLNIAADSQTKTYGSANPTLTVAYTGFINGDDATDLTTLATITTTATAASAVGSYPIGLSGGTAVNYTVTRTASTLVVTQAALTITANSLTKNYGAVNPTLTVSYDGFVNGDNATKLSKQPTLSTTAVTASPAGIYPITATGATATNYNISYVAGNLQVNPVALTVTATSVARAYGAANPTFAVTYTGFVNGDNATKLSTQPTISTTATITSNAGTYDITPIGAISPNYNITYVNGVLTINKVALAIKADNQSRGYGLPNPALTVTYTGFVNGDDASSLTTQPTVVTAATTASPTGTYAITASGAVSTNYTPAYTAGTLTVTPVNRVFAFNALPVKTYLDADFDPGATVNTGETIVYTSNNTAVATIVNGNIHITGAGTANITATVPNNTNYTNVTPIIQVLTVNRAAQSITFAAVGPLLKGSSPLQITVTSTSGLPVGLSSADKYTVTVDDNGNGNWTVNPLHIGSALVTALQPGDTNYLPAILIQNIVVQTEDKDLVYVTPALSPNGDGVNDFLMIENIKEYPDNKLTIFNRNGVKIYQMAGYDNLNKMFDGHSNVTGSMMQQGSYFYVLEYKIDGQAKKKSGFIIIKN